MAIPTDELKQAYSSAESDSCEIKSVDCGRCPWDGLSHLTTELRTCDRCLVNPNFKLKSEINENKC